MDKISEHIIHQRRWNITPHLLSMGDAWWLLSKDCVWNDRGRGTLQWRNLINTTSSLWSRSTPAVIVCTLEIMWWEGHFSSAIFLSTAHNPSRNMRETSDKSKLRDSLQNTWPTVLTTVKVTKKKNLRKCHSQEEPKQTWQLNTMRCPVWDPGKEKGQ